MKKIASSIIICLYFFSSSLSAQKDITFEEIFTKSSLNPINLSRLQWITGSNTYSWVLNKNGEKLEKACTYPLQYDTLFGECRPYDQVDCGNRIVISMMKLFFFLFFN